MFCCCRPRAQVVPSPTLKGSFSSILAFPPSANDLGGDASLLLRSSCCKDSFAFLLGAIVLHTAAVLGCAALVWSHVPMCREVRLCTETVAPLQLGGMDMDSTPRSRAAALGVLLVKELFSLISAIREAQEYPLEVFVKWWQSQLLLCIVLAVLMSAELVAVNFGVVWHAVPPAENFDPSWRWVNSVRVVEWMVNMPLILCLTGHYLLRRPQGEMLAPVLVTTAYICLTWQGLITDNLVVRASLLMLSFAGFGVSVLHMYRWVCAFRLEFPPSKQSHTARLALVGLLVLNYAAIGVVLLVGAFGLISPRVEEEVYALNAFMAKLTLVFALGIVRARERRDALRDINSKVTALNQTFVPMLLHEFDFLVLCAVEGGETPKCVMKCELKDCNLGAFLGREIQGMDFEELLPHDARAAFRAQLQVALAGESEALEAVVRMASSCSGLSSASSPWSRRYVLACGHRDYSRLHADVKLRAITRSGGTPRSGLRQLLMALRVHGQEEEEQEKLPKPVPPKQQLASTGECPTPPTPPTPRGECPPMPHSDGEFWA